jgi:hypothetical protein
MEYGHGVRAHGPHYLVSHDAADSDTPHGWHPTKNAGYALDAVKFKFFMKLNEGAILPKGNTHMIDEILWKVIKVCICLIMFRFQLDWH